MYVNQVIKDLILKAIQSIYGNAGGLSPQEAGPYGDQQGAPLPLMCLLTNTAWLHVGTVHWSASV